MPALALSIIAVLALAGFFVWLVTRAWPANRGLVKWPGVLLSALLALVLGLVGIVALVGFARLYIPQGNPPPTIQVTSTPDGIARGERLVHLCVGCHSSNKEQPPLDGSVENFGEGFGTVYPPNLTPGGPLREWTDGEIVRAIREGVDETRRPLIIMPSNDYHGMSDDDVQAVVAYLRSQPAIANDSPETSLGLLGALVIGSGMFQTSAQPPITGPVAAPPAGQTKEYGGYLVGIAACRTCHGPTLSGGGGGFVPPGPSLAAIVPSWTDAQFIATIRNGADPSGHTLDPEQMPWRELSATFTDDDLRAIYAYIRDLGQQR